MSFSPIIPFGGLQGWQFLSRTLPRQLEAYSDSTQNQRDTNHFSENIKNISSAEQLVSDSQLLRVALTAFGLEDDLPNKFLITKVLSDGSSDSDALANKFSDKRYLEFAKAFGFGENETPKYKSDTFAKMITQEYTRKSFEIQVGLQDQDLRLAMSMEVEIDKILSMSDSDTANWLAVLGNPPMKNIFEKAFRIPEQGTTDLDAKVSLLRERQNSLIGSPEIKSLEDPDNITRVRQNFLLASQLDTLSFSGDSVALQLLQSRRSIRF